MSKERQVMLDCFKTHYIAHRGLFDNAKDAPENTILAFKRAVEAGYGIELDVQLSKDNHVVVAHDYSLKRICGVDKEIRDLTYQELNKYNILYSSEKIPLLTEALHAIDGKAPIIVEIKAERDYEETCMFAAEILSAYAGAYCIESFSPFVLGWYKRNHPEVIRGQLADDFLRKKHFKSTLQNWALTNMIFNTMNKPDFIAYNHQFSDKKCIGLWKKILGCSLAAWTIKSQTELDYAVKMFDIIIFDGFIPK
jgi:glycerophosphoryl diester phosphodiesterase